MSERTVRTVVALLAMLTIGGGVYLETHHDRPADDQPPCTSAERNTLARCYR